MAVAYCCLIKPYGRHLLDFTSTHCRFHLVCVVFQKLSVKKDSLKVAAEMQKKYFLARGNHLVQSGENW
jgi:putative component of membrane protein insertase Oxa1/YidC/SpoIIIJ protein YidD